MELPKSEYDDYSMGRGPDFHDASLANPGSFFAAVLGDQPALFGRRDPMPRRPVSSRAPQQSAHSQPVAARLSRVVLTALRVRREAEARREEAHQAQSPPWRAQMVQEVSAEMFLRRALQPVRRQTDIRDSPPHRRMGPGAAHVRIRQRRPPGPPVLSSVGGEKA